MSLQIPNTSKYTEKVSEISTLFKKLVNDATTAVGSGIYELVIRPTSAIYAAVTDEISKWYNDYTLSELSKSTNRKTGPADAILSNYFITRNEGRRASAVVTIYSTDTFTKVPKGTVFYLNDIPLYATDTVYGSYLDHGVYTDGSYVKAYKSGEYYCFSVSVHTEGPSSMIVSEGMPVDIVSYIPGVDHAVLSSALAGGSDIETDAEMISRAKKSIMSWIGSSESIHKILNTSGFTVYSSKSFDNKNAEMSRNHGSNMYMNTGSMIDTYVKTALYPMTGTATIDTNGVSELDVTKHIPAGCLCVSDVTAEDGNHIGYSVQWGSSNENITPEGARLSIYQTTTLSLKESAQKVTITYTYMPYIAELQQYINMPKNRLLGWDILIKAAVPAVFTLRGSMYAESSNVNDIINDVTASINITNVGYKDINLADIQSVISSNYNNVLTSPTLMSATCLDYSGNTYVCSSSSGVLDIRGSGTFTGNIMFLCAETSGVMIE